MYLAREHKMYSTAFPGHQIVNPYHRIQSFHYLSVIQNDVPILKRHMKSDGDRADYASSPVSGSQTSNASCNEVIADTDMIYPS